MEHLAAAKTQNPGVAGRMAEIEAQTQKFAASSAASAKSSDVITIPVVVHVLYNSLNPATNVSDAKIQSQIDALNEDFRMLNSDFGNTLPEFQGVAADFELEFCLAQRDPDGFPTSGITRTPTLTTVFDVVSDDAKHDETGGKQAWPATGYLNMWVVPNLEADGSEILGYAQFPGESPTTDGVVIIYDAFGTAGGTLLSGHNLGRTATHEIGHWLNLYHVWGDGGCNEDDFVADTPRSNTAHYGCVLNDNTCTDSPVDLVDMTQNFMDYSDDDCTTLFTQGQKSRARALFEPGGAKHALTTSMGCLPVLQGPYDVMLSGITNPEPSSFGNCTTIKPLIEITNFGTEPLTNFVVNYSIAGQATQFVLWEGTLAPAATTEYELPSLTVPDGLLHELTITLSDPNGAVDFDETNNAATVSFATISTGGALPLVQGFESAVFPPTSWSVGNPDGTQTFERYAGTGAQSTGNCVYIRNYGYNDQGQVDELITSSYNFAGDLEEINLRFDCAYALVSAGNLPDVLEVWVSVDCGATFGNVAQFYGSDLITAAPSAGEFVPSGDSEWQSHHVDLTAYAGYPNVTVMFRQTRGQGNNLYLDNLLVNGIATGLGSQPLGNRAFAMLVYPNPSTSGDLNVQCQVPQSGEVWVKLSDKTGRILAERRSFATSGGNSLQLATDGLPTGIYFVTLSDGTFSQTQKVLLVR